MHRNPVSLRAVSIDRNRLFVSDESRSDDQKGVRSINGISCGMV